VSGVIGAVVGSTSAFFAIRWLGVLWGVLAIAALMGLFLSCVELWYRVIWPLDAHKPSLPWNRPKEDA
jgi:hypothetical protein